ncbi:MAG: hypothetical protein JXB88_18150 [Spirochaetales bacterium]|nr:hypothetical protein [Spirochaetales bacterium]
MKKGRAFIIAIILSFCLFPVFAEETMQVVEESPESTGEEADTSSSAYTPGKADAGNSGAFTYSFPLKLPGGKSSPELALSYSSDDWNSGIAGKGWMISGLSVMSRDSSYPINFDEYDHYLYNNRRLIWVKDNAPDVINPGYYHLERESFIRIQAFDLNSPSSYWTVTLKNGTVLSYGCLSQDHTAASDGHIDAIGKGGKARLWALNKITDIHNNSCIIEYFEDDTKGSYYPVKITWTKNETSPLSKYHTVEFSYEARTDYAVKYIPTRVQEDKRLKWIVVKTDDRLVRKYKLDYDQGAVTGQGRLTAITEYGDDGSTPFYGDFPLAAGDYDPDESGLPPVEFTYSDGSTTALATPTTQIKRSRK